MDAARQRRPAPGAVISGGLIENCWGGIGVGPDSSIALENLTMRGNDWAIKNEGVIRSRGLALEGNEVGIDNAGDFDGPDTIIK